MNLERFTSLVGLLVAGWIFGGAASPSVADEVWLQNGDRLTGRVLDFTNSTFTITNHALGILRVPRAEVREIYFGNGSSTVTAAARPPQELNSAARRDAGTPDKRPALAAPPSTSVGFLAGLGNDTNLVQSVKDQFLNGATPEVHAKFNEMLGGLLTGKLSENDIRAEARSAAAQLRAARKDMGDDAGFAIDGYLAILDRFVGEEQPQKAVKKNGAVK